MGQLTMTGWLDFIVPMGDRVVALGHEDRTGGAGPRDFPLAVFLFDASAPTPTLLSRVTLGGTWGWVPGDRDDFAKVFKVLPELGLIVFPFQSWDTPAGHVAGVQLIDFFRDTLTRRGVIQDAGCVRRVIPYDARTILTLSDSALQVVDVVDRDRPMIRAHLELASNVLDFCPAPPHPPK